MTMVDFILHNNELHNSCGIDLKFNSSKILQLWELLDVAEPVFYLSSNL